MTLERCGNVTKEKAVRAGLTVGKPIKHVITVQLKGKPLKMIVKQGTVVEISTHGFVAQMGLHKEFFRYNLLRRREAGEWVEIG